MVVARNIRSNLSKTCPFAALYSKMPCHFIREIPKIRKRLTPSRRWKQ